MNDGGPWVLEVAARSIGGLCSRTLRFGTGMSLEELILRHALGWPIDSLVRERRDRFYRALLKRLREQGEIVVNEPVIQSIDQG